jgi:hypothetical protein
MIDEETLKREIKKPLSEDEIRKAVKKIGSKVKIIAYPDLQKYDSINSLFGSRGSAEPNYKYIVLLYTADEKKTGHWVLLIKHSNDKIELFDSYAYRPDNLLKFFKKNGREMYPLLSHLLLKSGVRDLIFSTTRLQRLRNDIGVCGRWCIVRILYDLEGKSLADMLKDIRRNKHFPKGYYDGWVVYMTMDLV